MVEVFLRPIVAVSKNQSGAASIFTGRSVPDSFYDKAITSNPDSLAWDWESRDRLIECMDLLLPELIDEGVIPVAVEIEVGVAEVSRCRKPGVAYVDRVTSVFGVQRSFFRCIGELIERMAETGEIAGFDVLSDPKYWRDIGS